ncbi:MAG: DUF1700 domain-containing protein [Clostridia bacterium]|nr:DUF1700 domain-containing protein [Clostridia bacterium]
MTKQEFLDKLQAGLSGLTESDAQERLTFYSEMIDDRMEEGLAEEQAVARIGDVQTIIDNILAEIPQRAAENAAAEIEISAQDKEMPKKEQRKGMESWQILLLILGFPLWLPLLAAAFFVVISLIAVLWSMVGTLWGALFGTLAGVGLGVTLFGLFCIIAGNWVMGIALFGGGLACIGLAVFAFYGCIYATKGAAWLTKMTFVGIAKLFKRRRDA